MLTLSTSHAAAAVAYAAVAAAGSAQIVTDAIGKPLLYGSTDHYNILRLSGAFVTGRCIASAAMSMHMPISCDGSSCQSQFRLASKCPEQAVRALSLALSLSQ